MNRRTQLLRAVQWVVVLPALLVVVLAHTLVETPRWNRGSTAERPKRRGRS